MKFTGFLQKITYSTLCFVLLFSTVIHVTIAEEVAVEPESSPIEITIDEPTTGMVFNMSEINVKGTIDAAATIKLFLNNQSIESEVVITNNTWESTLVQLAEGEYELVAKATDLEEKEYVSNSVTFSIDTTSPAIEITNIKDGDFTNKTVVEGQTEANLLVRILLDGVEDTDEEDQLYSDSNGLWLFDLNGVITEGTHLITAVATDKVGNEGTSSAIEFTFNQTRPFITPNIFPRANRTKVSLATVIKVNIVDDHPISEQDILPIPYRSV